MTVRNGMDTRRAIARGRDIYAFTAPLVVEAVQRNLDRAAEEVSVLAPGDMFDAPDSLRALVPEHLTFESDKSILRGSEIKERTDSALVS